MDRSGIKHHAWSECGVLAQLLVPKASFHDFEVRDVLSDNGFDLPGPEGDVPLEAEIEETIRGGMDFYPSIPTLFSGGR